MTPIASPELHFAQNVSLTNVKAPVRKATIQRQSMAQSLPPKTPEPSLSWLPELPDPAATLV